MTHRIFLAASLTFLILAGTVTAPASAQEVDPTYELLTLEASRLVRPHVLLTRMSTPVQIDSLSAPSAAAVGEVIPFQAYTNAACAALPVRARWHFSDGTMAEGLHARHHFDAPGTYTAVFTFSNRHAEVTDSITVQVERPRMDW